MYGQVSIIMPSYNTAKFIGDSIRSVLAQTYENWELLIVDDCSTDQTDAVVAEFDDPRIRYFKNERNSGAAISRNWALREAQGEWIAFLDSDDLWEAEKLEKQLIFMKETGASFSYTGYQEIDEQGNPLGVTVTGPARITRNGMYRYCWPGCLTVMYHRGVVGLIQIADIKKNNDYAMWLKVIEQAECRYMSGVWASYRKRTGSISRNSVKVMISWHYRLFREAQGRNPVSSAFHTARNLVFGVWKKLVYVKRG